MITVILIGITMLCTIALSLYQYANELEEI